MKNNKFTAPFLFAVIAMLLLTAAHAPAQNVSQAELRFREALHKQQVEGDLNGAIKLYQSIVDAKTTDRVVRAKALLQLAGCYETLGKESQNLYQRIVTDFADQPAGKVARAKLDALKPPVPPATMTLRKIELGAGIQNVVATDGQRAVYWDSTNTTLYIGDVGGKERQVVYRTEGTPRTVVSRDLSMVLFYFPQSEKQAGHYAVIRTDGTGYRDLALLREEANSPSRCITWSWDNRYLLICQPRAGTTRLLKFSLADGAVQDMFAGRDPEVSWATFSPDGKFIAYQSAQTLGAVYVIPSAGGEPQLAAAAANLGDWTRDGRLMITSVESGSPMLSLVPIQNGRPSGGPISSIRLSSLPRGGLSRTMWNGSVIIVADPTVQRYWGVLDPQDRVSEWKPLDLIGSGASFPAWSSDSRQIAYISRETVFVTAAVRVRDLVNGADREVYRHSSPYRLFTCLWAHQRPNIFCGQLAPGKTEILSISPDSGRAESLGTLDGTRTLLRVSPDDRALVGVKQETRVPYEWEIATNRENTAGIPGLSSDDGRWKIEFRIPDADNRRQIRIRPTSSTENDWKRVAYLAGQDMGTNGPATIKFSPDGNWVVYVDKDPDGKLGFYRVSTASGDPMRLGDYPILGPQSFFAISPDNRQFVVEGPRPADQPVFWAVENLVSPSASTSKPAPKTPAK